MSSDQARYNILFNIYLFNVWLNFAQYPHSSLIYQKFQPLTPLALPEAAFTEAWGRPLANRENAGLTQDQLAERLGETQSFVSKCECGERRIDIVELREFCLAMDTTLEKFIRTFERAL